MFELLFEKVNKFYERLFYKYGLFLSKHYAFVIVFSFIFNLILSSAIRQMIFITNSDDLFLLIDSQARRDEATVKKLFNTSQLLSKNIYLHQLPDLGAGGEINFHVAKGINDKNVLKQDIIDEIYRIHVSIVQQIKVIHDNKTYIFRDVCAKRMQTCWVEGADLLRDDFFKFLKEQSLKLAETNPDLNYSDYENMNFMINGRPNYMSDLGMLTDLSYTLGKNFKIYRKPIDNVYAFADLLKLRYSLNDDIDNQNPLIQKWENEFLSYVKTIKTNLTSFTYSASRSLEEEVNNNLSLDMWLISSTFVLIMVFATLFMSINSNIITSPGIILPASGIFSAMFGVSSSFGLLSIFGFPACALVFVIPFLVLGIGIDDCFIIYASFTHTDENLTTKERISITLEKAGVAITITSLTDFIAFVVGISTGFKSVQIFCVYAAFAILFCYFYQLTFFCGWLVVHSKRIKSNRNTFIWCIKHKTKVNENHSVEHNNCNHTHEINGWHDHDNHNHKDERDHGNHDHDHSLEDPHCNHHHTKLEDDVYCETTESLPIRNRIIQFILSLKNRLGLFYKYLIMETNGKIIIFFTFCVYISLFSWQASRIQEGIRLWDLVSEKSYANAYYQDHINSIELTPVVQLIINKPINYTSKSTLRKIENLINNAHKIKNVDNEFVIDWTDHYSLDLEELRYTKNYSIFKQVLKNDISPYSNDVVIQYNEKLKRDEIIASRVFIKYGHVYYNSRDAKLIHDLQELCQNSGLPVFAYSNLFKYYEQFEQTLPNILQTFVISSEAMYFIALMFVPDIVSALCIIASMVSIMVGLIGCMNLWGLTLSSITMIEVIMSVGFCIDFSAHITHTFIATAGYGSRSERAYAACIRTGVPIFNSAVSSIIGVTMLSFAESYIFMSFFKTMFILMTLGILNSMFFLPVLLSVVGPHWKRHVDPMKLKHHNQFVKPPTVTLSNPLDDNSATDKFNNQE